MTFLEKLFIKILDKTKNRKFKINSEMMNLLGCTRENFSKFLMNMNYKKSKEEDTFFFAGDNNIKKNIQAFKKRKSF